MSLKDEAKAADASLRKAIKDVEQLGWLTVISKYNGELRSNLQMARQDVERLTVEARSCKDRAIGVEAKVEGLETTIASLKQQIEGLEAKLRLPQGPRVVVPNMYKRPEALTPAELRGRRIWAPFIGLSSYPRVMSDAAMVQYCVDYIEEYGLSTFLDDFVQLLLDTELDRDFDVTLWSQPDAEFPEFSPLPSPTVVFAEQGKKGRGWSVAASKGLVLNPVYVGVGVDVEDSLVRKDEWCRGIKRIFDEDGIPQTLVNILYLLHVTFPRGKQPWPVPHGFIETRSE